MKESIKVCRKEIENLPNVFHIFENIEPGIQIAASEPNSCAHQSSAIIMAHLTLASPSLSPKLNELKYKLWRDNNALENNAHLQGVNRNTTICHSTES
jgi:hypothetical protein